MFVIGDGGSRRILGDSRRQVLAIVRAKQWAHILSRMSYIDKVRIFARTRA